MQAISKFIFAILMLFTSSIWAQTTNDFEQKAQQIFAKHFQQFKDLEYFSGAALAIQIPHQAIKNFYIGTVSHDEHSPKISADTLFQIGSITKSFTAAVMLQLEKEHKLNINDTLHTLLPQYEKWGNVTLKALLNMTSGLPNYSEAPSWNCAIYKNPSHLWTSEELIHFAYPSSTFSPPLKKGYFYSNTGYILMGLIAAKLTNNLFTNELIERTIKRASLTNTFYTEGVYDKSLQSRMAHGYSYNQYDNPELVGHSIWIDNTAWAGAAGGAIATMEDVIKWVKALFISNEVIDASQKHKLMELISLNDGKPITKTDSLNVHGFGLGIAQAFDKKMGRYWFYEGETLGFRTLYMYFPCNGVIVASSFNSATNNENDHAGLLMTQIYELIVSKYPKLHCLS